MRLLLGVVPRLRSGRRPERSRMGVVEPRSLAARALAAASWRLLLPRAATAGHAAPGAGAGVLSVVGQRQVPRSIVTAQERRAQEELVWLRSALAASAAVHGRRRLVLDDG
ncbi:MAG: hypothetical protein Q8R78_06140, partial [Candidatus Omnitrophota bacterium]|nr:hypothetical protein [Candidatus Omnitrophota bacterium]